MILKNAKAKIVKRSQTERIKNKIYAIEINGERITPYMMSPEGAIKYLQSTGNSYRHINVQLENGDEYIYLNRTYHVINNGRTYTLFNKGCKIKSFRCWHRLMEHMNK